MKPKDRDPEQQGHKRKTQAASERHLRELMGSSRRISHVFKQVGLVAATDFTVLLSGETGSGKELVARAIHTRSRRSSGPFVPVDCGSIPSGLIENELFGHEKGSFTGADRAQPGKFEVASGGTLFLDEISNLPLNIQPKLLRAVQEKQVWHVGGIKTRKVDIRVIVAANEDLSALVKARTFRRDLYHRLNEFNIAIPPLRERRQDIAHLAKRFIDQTNKELAKNVKGLSGAALEPLLSYSWPGNVRELRNVIRRAVLTADEFIEPDHLGILGTLPGRESSRFDPTKELEKGASLRDIVQRVVMQVERDVLVKVLRETGGNKAEAARILHIDYKTIHKKVRKYDIPSKRGSD